MKNIILMIITTLAFSYIIGYVFMMALFTGTFLGHAIWCVCGIWLALFVLANTEEERHEDYKTRQ